MGVHLKCSEFYIMVGKLGVAEDQVRKASWMCRFVNFENMLLECLELSITLAMFSGKVGKAKKLADQSEVDMPKPKFLAIWARCAIICGDYASTKAAIERFLRVEPGMFERDLSGMKKLIENVNQADVLL